MAKQSDNGKQPERRRVKGEGSLYQRDDGRWVAQVISHGADGKRQIARRVRLSQGDARRELTKLKGKQDSHRLVITGKATVRAFLDVWLEEYIKPSRAPRTYKSYFETLKRHLPDSIGNLPLNRLAAETVQRHLNALGRNRTAEYMRQILRSAFNRAVKLGRMDTNPVLATESVQYERAEQATFTAVQANRILAVADNYRLGALCITAMSVGLRKGEVCGLKPADVDLEGRVIHVRRSLQWIKMPGEKEEGHWIERPPKRGSKRDLPMTDTIYRALLRYMARRQEEAASTGGWKDSGYLFVSVTGAPLHERNVSEAFHRLCDAAKVPRLRFHDTRHTAGTLLHAQGATTFVIQTVLGHSQLSTTRRYVSVPIEVLRAAVDKKDAAVSATPQPQPEPTQAEPSPKLPIQ